MKEIIAFLILLICFRSFAAEKIQLESIGFGSEFRLKGVVELPKGQKLNQKAPSKIAVYELNGNDWVLTENLDLNDFFSLTELINFQKPIKLKSKISKIKIEASLYHCPRLGKGICVIDDFEGLIERNDKMKTTDLRLALRGREPK